MLSRIPVLLVFTIISLGARAQTKPGAPAAGGGAGASTPTSASAQTGYVYYLKYQRHIQYVSTRVDTFYFTYDYLDPKKTGKVNLFGVDIAPDKLVQANVILDRTPNEDLTPDRINPADYDLRSFKTTAACIDPAKCKYAETEKDTVLIVLVTYNDSIPRYWPGNRTGPLREFKRSRLRVAINQDSALLSARIFYDNFDDTPRTSHVRCVTNQKYSGINFTNTAEQDRARIDYIARAKAAIEKSMPELLAFDTSKFIPARDVKARSLHAKWVTMIRNFRTKQPDSTIDVVNTIFDSTVTCYTSASPSEQKAIYELAVVQYQAVAKAYRDDMALLYPRDGQKSTKRKAKQNQKKEKREYRIVFEAHNKLRGLYTDQISVTKAEIDDDRTSLSAVEGDARRSKALKYLEKLYDLKTPPTNIPPVLPDNTFGVTIPEKAIPLNGNDTATNFYFRIIHKNTLHQPIYFLPLHYGTNDYGAMTIPFRYRFPQSNHTILAVAGSSITAPVPEESDANLSVAAYFGRKWGRTRFYEDPTMTHNTFSAEVVGFTGPTLIPLSATNVANKSRFINDSSDYVGPTNIIAWSLGAGAVIEWKTINFGLFGGWDFPLVANSGWVYGRQFWVGFGIGVNLGIFSSGNSVN